MNEALNPDPIGPHAAARPPTDQLASRISFGIALILTVIVLVATVLVFPISGRPLAVIKPFISMFATATVLIEALTSFFLAVQYRTTRAPHLAVLSGAYGFVAVMVSLQALTFPGLFSATGLLGAGPQTAIVIWTMWHTGFPILVLLSFLVQAAPVKRVMGALLPPLAVMMMVAPPVLAFGLCYLAIIDWADLPPLLHDGSYSALTMSPAGFVIVTSIILALAACVRVTRLRDMLSLWIAIALVASLGDAILVLSAGARFTLGWYAGRLLSLLSSAVVLCALVTEFSILYARLAGSVADLSIRAMNDGLTGAYNRSFLNEQLPRAYRRSVRDASSLSLLMLDVDHFKTFNDAHGHPAGDQCLIRIVEIINSCVTRPGDFVARYGGEEFAILLADTNRSGARQLAQTIIRSIRDAKLFFPGSPFGIVTVSIGIATFFGGTDMFDEHELIYRADTALYKAKTRGRDRWVAYERIIEWSLAG